MMRRRKNYTLQQLPDEIILYIMSYLPNSSLSRCRCVCKLWNTLFLHPDLFYLHYRHSGYDLKAFLVDSTADSFYATKSSQGLLLEQERNAPSRYRIHCAELRQTLAIPNPQNPSLCIALEFVHSDNRLDDAVKLVSVYEDEQYQHSLGYEILVLGIGSRQSSKESRYCWRTVKVPPPNLLKSERDGRNRKRIQVFFRMGVAYYFWYVETEDIDVDIEVDVLDMVNETYIGHTTLSRGKGFFSKLSSTSLLDWNGRLSFAQLVKDELHVLVLDDYKKLKWAETKRIIKLPFLKPDHKERITFSTFAGNYMLFFVRQHKKSFCNYDINTGKLKTIVMSDCIDSVEGIAVQAAQLMFYEGIA